MMEKTGKIGDIKRKPFSRLLGLYGTMILIVLIVLLIVFWIRRTKIVYKKPYKIKKR